MTTLPHLHPDFIDPHAKSIVKTLQDKGFTAYVVGGCVRDLLLGIQPKDFDIATTASPAQIRRSISQSYIIGKRFRLVLVKRGTQVYEVATFRKEASAEESNDDEGEHPQSDNVFGSPDEDAHRRDFTINGLFYDPIKDELIDFLGAQKDLKEGVVRMIGDPQVRLCEDPIRILRAIRLAYKIKFGFDPDLHQALHHCRQTLADTALPRRREEFLKFLRVKEPLLPFLHSYDLGVLEVIAPSLHQVFSSPKKQEHFATYMQALPEKDFLKDDPRELFGTLVLAFYRATMQLTPTQSMRSKELLANPQIMNLMRDELGMFKYEQAFTAKAIYLQNTLNKVDDFKKRGGRSLSTLVQNESFPFALKLAKMDMALPPKKYAFWTQTFDEFFQKGPESLNQTYPPQKKRRKRKKSSISQQELNSEEE